MSEDYRKKMCKYSIFGMKMIHIQCILYTVQIEQDEEARPEAHGRCKRFAAAAVADASRGASGTVGDLHLQER